MTMTDTPPEALRDLSGRPGEAVLEHDAPGAAVHPAAIFVPDGERMSCLRPGERVLPRA